MIRTLVLIGTRPEAIKMCPVHIELGRRDGFESTLVSTGQHREMLEQVLDVFSLSLDHDLRVMTANQSLAGLTSKLVSSIDPILDEISPDLLLVQGDTTSVMAGALCGFYRNIPVGHVEAGLRTGNLRSPFPEEANRVLTSRLTSFHFAPTKQSRTNLLDEGVSDEDIVVTGNTVIDALFLETERQENNEKIREGLEAELREMLSDANAPTKSLDNNPYILITGHRRENFGGGFEDICEAIHRLADRYPNHHFIYPVHLNPNVNEVVRSRLSETPNVILLPPVHYRMFVYLMRNAKLLLTDSGGVQEEAPSLGKPVLVMRDTTERPEGITAGTVRLVGTCPDKIVAEVSTLLDNPEAYSAMAQAQNPYGDGQASRRIVDFIEARMRN